jgi:hypothetical protein
MRDLAGDLRSPRRKGKVAVGYAAVLSLLFTSGFPDLSLI